MADSFYYQDNGQTIGPLTPGALKQLANQGVVRESTPVRKGDQGAWYQAGTIAGLVSPRPVQVAAPEVAVTEADQSPLDLSGEGYRLPVRKAEAMAAGMGLLDFKFARFFTPRNAGLIWAAYLGLVALTLLYVLFVTMRLIIYFPSESIYHIGFFIYSTFALVVAVLFGRAWLEAKMATFRIDERLGETRPEQARPPVG